MVYYGEIYLLITKKEVPIKKKYHKEDCNEKVNVKAK